MESKKQHIVVLGAGVIGLQTAVTLLEAGCAVTVVADEWADTAIESQSWTSPWAGAQWRAHATANTAAAGWEATTYHAWARIHAEEAAAGYANGQGPSSLASIMMDNVWGEAMVPAERPLWWSVLDPDSYAEIPTAELPPGCAYGARMRAFTLDPARHLKWLMQRMRALGGHEVRARLDIPAAAATKGPRTEASALANVVAAARAAVASSSPLSSSPEISAFVNALGLGVLSLGIDTSMVSNRGQTVLVHGETTTMRTRVGPSAGDVIAIIPRPGTGTTIVGSTRGPGRVDAAEDPSETQWLLDGGREVAPDLFTPRPGYPLEQERKRGQLIAARVGFRPRRGAKGLGARVEKEYVSSIGAGAGGAGTAGEDARKTLVVHAYGHEGAGFQQAVGTAETVAQLLGMHVSKTEANAKAKL